MGKPEKKSKTDSGPIYQVCIQLPWSLSPVEFRTQTIDGGTCQKGERTGAECGGHTYSFVFPADKVWEIPIIFSFDAGLAALWLQKVKMTT